MLPGRNDQGHENEAEGIWNVSFFQSARRNGGSIDEFAMEGSGTTSFCT